MESTEIEDGHLVVGLEDLPEPYPLDLSALKDQNDFGEAAFELLKETSTLLFYLAYRAPDRPLERNEAIRRGLIKRLNLLGKSLLSDICNNSGYQQLQICRQVVEAASNYLYLAENDSGSRHDAYVLDSLASEKANLALIDEQVEARGGEVLPIEERMRRSMERTASVAGVDLDAVPGREKSGWPSALERLQALSPTAYPSYRSGSLAVHSGWTVLLLQDIVDVPGGFSLDPVVSPSLQPMTAAATVIAETSAHYVDAEGDDVERAFFAERLEDVIARVRDLDAAHEDYMQSLEEEPGADGESEEEATGPPAA